MNANLGRAHLLFEQGRYDLAMEEIGRQIAQDPDDPFAHSLLALCYSKLKQHDNAASAAQTATHLAPDLGYTYYVLGSVLDDVPRLKEAEAAAREAIRIDPEDDDFYALLSSIRFQQQHWPDALRYADAGLAINADNITCANLRGMALVQLGRKEDAGETIQGTLAKDPENATAHANQGWALLHRGKPKEALEHFKEALRLRPDMEWARQGIREALRARNPLYRLILNYFLWMSRLGRQVRTGVLVGLYILPRALRAYATNHPALAPFSAVVFGVYLVFAFLTWTAKPLFNVLLRVDKIGRYALTRQQIVASNWVGTSFLLAVLAAVSGLIVHDEDFAVILGGGFAFLTAITAATFSGSTLLTRRITGSLTALVGLLLIGGALYLTYSISLGFGLVTSLLIAGLLAFNITAQIRTLRTWRS